MSHKTSVRFDTTTTLDEAIGLLEDLCSALHSERVVIARGEESVELSPARAVGISVRARRKGRSERLRIELDWTSARLRAVPDEEEGDEERIPEKPTSLAERREQKARERRAAEAATAKEADERKPARKPPERKKPATKAEASPGNGDGAGLRRHLAALSRDRLYELAQDLEIEGRSRLSKEELIEELRHRGVTRRLTRVDLLTMARAEEIAGASEMKKAELAHALAS